MRLIVPSNMTLLEALALLSPESSKTTLRSWVEQGRVRVDGKLSKKPSTPVNEGEEVRIGKGVQVIELEIKILFEDKHIVVIDKPEGLLSVATDFDAFKTAHGVLKRRFPSRRVFPVHRLDRETSGVMVFTYTEEAREELKRAFEKHTIDREYVGIIEGHLKEKKGTWKSYLVEDPSYTVRSTKKDKEGQLSVTHYEVLGTSQNCTLLRLQLETGRKNQIRVHCSEAGHPIVGDEKYGAKTNPIKRLCLHARKLGFVHPLSGKKMKFEVPIPDEFHKIVSLQSPRNKS